MPKTKPRDLLNPKRKALPRRAKERRSPPEPPRRAKVRRSSFRSLPRPLKPEARERKDPRNPERERRRAEVRGGSFRSLPRPLPPPKPLPRLT